MATPKKTSTALAVAQPSDETRIRLAEIDLRKAELKLMKEGRLTQAQRAQMMELFRLRKRPEPVSQCQKLLQTSEVLKDIQAEIALTPEYKIALDAVLALAQSVAKTYGYQAAPMAVHSSGTLMINHSGSDGTAASEDVVNHVKRDRNQPIKAYNRQFEAAEKAATDAYNLEMTEKRTVINTATTREEILRLVPECQVQLPTLADREAIAAGSWAPGRLTAAPLPAACELDAELV